MNKDEMKNRISLALKDPILQQGFECICKENAELKELKEKNKSYEGYVNDISLVIDPCKMCKVYKEHNGYDTGDRLVNNEWRTGVCDNCCWFYGSKFEIGIDDNSCETCRHKAKMLTG